MKVRRRAKDNYYTSRQTVFPLDSVRVIADYLLTLDRRDIRRSLSFFTC
jgi:hypothetical protein